MTKRGIVFIAGGLGVSAFGTIWVFIAWVLGKPLDPVLMTSWAKLTWPVILAGAGVLFAFPDFGRYLASLKSGSPLLAVGNPTTLSNGTALERFVHSDSMLINIK